MKFDWGYLFGMALQSVPEPRKVARDILALEGLPRNVLWQALALTLVASAWLGVLSALLFPVDPATAGPLLGNPLLLALTEAAISGLSVFAIFWVGRMAGGTGSFNGAILVVIWLQFVLLIVELGVLFLGTFAPGLALVLWAMGIVMSFWVLSHFTAELHGFSSAGMVFFGILLTMLVLIVVLSVVLALIGFGAATDTGAT